MPNFTLTSIQPAVNMKAMRAAPVAFDPSTAPVVEAMPVRNLSDDVARPVIESANLQTGMIAPEHLRVINPEIWGRIGGCLPVNPTGVPRASLDCPVAPSGTLSDTSVFEGAIDQQVYHVPRYRLARQTVNGTDQYAIRFEQSGVNWILKVSLEKFRAPELATSVVTSEIAHELLLRLIFSSAVAGGGSVTKELQFQNIGLQADTGLLVATLQFSSIAERDQALAAITTAGGGAGLRVSRAVKVGVPNGQPNPLYNVTTCGFDMIAEPNPLLLNLALNKYLLEGDAPPPKKTGFTPHQLPWRDRFFTYWQDAGRPEHFYYLPDEFRLARRTQAPFLPMCAIKVAGNGANPDSAQMTFEFVAVPWVDPGRLADARRQLARRIAAGDDAGQQSAGNILGGLLGGVLGGATGSKVGAVVGSVVNDAIDGSADGSNLHFEPLMANKATLWLALPGVNGAAGGMVERPDAQVDVRAALVDAEVFTLPQFQSVWQALFGGSISLLRGEVRLDLGGGVAQSIPVIIRLDATAGELLTSAIIPGSAVGTLQLTLTNQTESPVLLRKLNAVLSRDKARKPATLDGKTFSPPMEIAPGASVEFTLTPAGGPVPAPGVLRASVGFDAISGKANPEAVWSALLDPSTSSDFARNIDVEAFGSMFDGPATAPNDKAQVILVEFERGTTVQLTPANLKSNAVVHTPIAEYVLQKGDTINYRYRCKVMRNSSRQTDKEWRTDSTDILFPELPSP